MTLPSQHYDAVLSLSIQSGNQLSRVSGSALMGGEFVLTAAHFFANITDITDIAVSGGAGGIKAVFLHPDWNEADSSWNHDLALVQLSNPLTGIDGLELYRQDDYIGKAFIKVGYGYGIDEAQHIGTNTFDIDAEAFNQTYNRNILAGTQAAYDYDDGDYRQDALGRLYGVGSQEPTEFETLAMPGDSGGPALIDGKIAGVGSYIARDQLYDDNQVLDYGPGEMGVDTLIYPHISWIDTVTSNVNSSNSEPTSPSDVIRKFYEPSYGSVTNHFLLSVESPLDQDATFWYETQDITAIAGEDFKYTSGWVTLEAGETSAAIAVEVYGDQIAESNEVFGLSLQDPTGHFLSTDIQLLAIHTIIDAGVAG